MARFSTAFALWLSLFSFALADDCSGTTTVKSQADLDAIGDCKNYTGNILLSEEASGDLEIKGIADFSGYIANELCESCHNGARDVGSSGVTSLSIELRTVANLTLEHMPALKSIQIRRAAENASDADGPKTVNMTTFSLYNLPALESFASDSFIAATNISLGTLPKLKSGDGTNATSMESIDALTNHPAIVDQVSIFNSPNLRDFKIGFLQAKYIAIHGNTYDTPPGSITGELSVDISPASYPSTTVGPKDKYIGELHLDGVKDLTWGRLPGRIGFFVLQSSNLTVLDLPRAGVDSIIVAKNPKLREIRGWDYLLPTAKEITIDANSNLPLTNETARTANGTFWTVPSSKPLSTVSLVGSLNPSFFNDFSQFPDTEFVTDLGAWSTDKSLDCDKLQEHVGEGKPITGSLDCRHYSGGSMIGPSGWLWLWAAFWSTAYVVA